MAVVLVLGGSALTQDRRAQTKSDSLPHLDIDIVAVVPKASPLELATPSYPDEVHVRVTGRVVVQVEVDKSGNVASARALSGHALLSSFAVDAARKSKFESNKGDAGKNVTGTITYTFRLGVGSYDDLQSFVGQEVAIRGEFSLRGKLGPFVLLNGKPIYLIAKHSVSWWKSYSEMEGKVVIATGTLRFFKAPRSEPADPAVSQVPDHYFLEAETAKIRLAIK